MPPDKKKRPEGQGKAPSFLGGVVRLEDVKKLKLGEESRVAFAGRSNVGKSSLLNVLTGARVARVSATPGKTREINFFRWRYRGRDIVLVDLPGYGYAKVGAELRQAWGREISAWLKADEHLALVVALVDGRHGYLEHDVELIRFLRAEQLSFLVAFTKMDKWKSANQLSVAKRELAKASKELGVERYVFASATSRDGVRSLEAELQKL